MKEEQTDKVAVTKMSYRLPELLKMFGISKPSLYRWIKTDGFPKPVKIGQIALWPVVDIQQWWANKTA